MANVILSIDEFMEKLSPGDTFWHMTSYHCAPDRIVEARIEKFGTDECGTWIQCVEDSSLKPGEKTSEKRHVVDLTNEFHGVFLTEKDAQEYFEERKVAYATDPDLISKVAKKKADSHSFFLPYGWDRSLE